eukprot:1470633-Pleurochrysis_carterae.AAC.1
MYCVLASHKTTCTTRGRQKATQAGGSGYSRRGSIPRKFILIERSVGSLSGALDGAGEEDKDEWHTGATAACGNDADANQEPI